MQAKVFSVVLLLILSCIAAQNITFDLFTLSVQWPNTLLTASSAPPQYFTIHGLWPNFVNATAQPYGPYFCPDAPVFNSTEQLGTIETDMEKYWKNLLNFEDDLAFWQYEYEKHGSCAIGHPLFPDIVSYFNTSLNLYKRLDIMSTLSTFGIVPSMKREYAVAEFKKAAEMTYGFAPIVTCSQDAVTNDSSILELHFCFDLDLQMISCSAETEEAYGCKASDIMFPLAKQDPAPVKSSSPEAPSLPGDIRTLIVVAVVVVGAVLGLLFVCGFAFLMNFVKRLCLPTLADLPKPTPVSDSTYEPATIEPVEMSEKQKMLATAPAPVEV